MTKRMYSSPFLRWAGSKRKLIPTLCTYWSSHFDRYLEPFVGSACLFFRLGPRRALLGDINAELMNVYRQVRDDTTQVALALSALRPGKREYLRLRAQSPDSLDAANRAARFIFLNRYCFNGLYRTNLRGEFNVPYGGNKSGQLPTVQHLQDVGRTLRRATLINGDFEKVLRRARTGDFVYMDPPFRVNGTRVFTHYDGSRFADSDVLRLRSWLERLDTESIQFLVSYAESDESRFLSDGFITTRRSVRRNIAGFTARRQMADEVLISNFRPLESVEC